MLQNAWRPPTRAITLTILLALLAGPTPAHAVLWRHASGEWYIPSLFSSSGETRTADKKAYPKGTAVHRAVQAHRHHGHRHPHAVLPDLVAADRPLRPDLALATPAHAAAVTVSRAPADPLDKAELLKEHLVAFYPKPTMLMATFATREMWGFVQNWWYHAQKAAMPGLLVIAMDDETKDKCDAAGMAAVGVSAFFKFDGCAGEHCSHAGVEGFRMHKESFNEMGYVKVFVLETILALGYSVLLSDVDVVWLRDPSQFLAAPGLRAADVAVTSDCIFDFMRPDQQVDDPYGQRRSVLNAEFNTGVLLVRATQAGRDFATRWRRAIEDNTDRRMNDQSHFNVVIKHSGSNFLPSPNPPPFPHAPCPSPVFKPPAHDPERPNACMFTAFERSSLSVAVLPTMHFPNGHIFFTARLPQRQGITPFAVHCTYQYSGTPGKRSRFREHGLWVDEPAYYDEGRFLSLQYNIPDRLLQPDVARATPKGDTPHAHLALVQYQVDMVRNGLAMARALDRIFVMPELVCICDRWFNLLPNCTSGEVVLPFICPADHIFRLNEWVGASIGFREYSFLRHPRLQFSAAWQSATPARVRLCGARPDLPACPALPPTSTSSGPALVPVGSTDGELKRHLEPLAHTKLLVIVDHGGEMFRGFDSLEDTDAFNRLAVGLTETWCCRKNGTVSHEMKAFEYI